MQADEISKSDRTSSTEKERRRKPQLMEGKRVFALKWRVAIKKKAQQGKGGRGRTIKNVKGRGGRY